MGCDVDIFFVAFWRFLLIYCHIPHICHRIGNALYKGISRDVWQSGSKFGKMMLNARKSALFLGRILNSKTSFFYLKMVFGKN